MQTIKTQAKTVPRKRQAQTVGQTRMAARPRPCACPVSRRLFGVRFPGRSNKTKTVAL